MQKIRVPVSSFQYGEISDSLIMRTDTAVYTASAQRLENMVVMAEGSVKKRYGMKHIYDYGFVPFNSVSSEVDTDNGNFSSVFNTSPTLAAILKTSADCDAGTQTLDGDWSDGSFVPHKGRKVIFNYNTGILPSSNTTWPLYVGDTITVTGTDLHGHTQTETMTIESDPSYPTYTTTKIFSSVTSISQPVQSVSGSFQTEVSMSIGVGMDMYYLTEEEQSHLYPFVFDENEEYIISVEHQRVRCFRLINGSDTVSLVATITADTSSAALPFDETYLKEYTTAQYGDVMFISHPLFAPRMLTRTSLTDFEISTYSFDQRADNKKTYQPYSKFQAHGVTLDPSATSGNGITLTTSANYWDTTGSQSGGDYPDSLHVGTTVRYGGNEIDITSVQSATQATGDVVDELKIRLSVLNPLRTIDGSSTVEVTHIAHGFGGGESITLSEASATGGINTGNLNGARTVGTIIDENTYTITAGGNASSSEDGGGYVKVTTHAPTSDWDEQSWSAKRGYPAAVEFHENRLCFGGTIAEPDNIWMSQIGEFFNFDVGDAEDTDSISMVAATGDINEIRYLVSNRDLQVFTASNELYIPTYLNQAITPTNAQIRKQTPYGVEHVEPMSIDGATIFVQNNGKMIREYIYTDTEEAYTATAVSTIASHLIDSPKYLSVVHSGFGLPDSYAALTLSNGDMTLFSSNRAEKRASWSRVTTNGNFGSVCSIEDRLFVNAYDSENRLQLCEFRGDIGLDFYLYGAIGSDVVDVSALYNHNDVVDVIATDGTTLSSLGQFTVNSSDQVDMSAHSGSGYTHIYAGKKFTAKLVTNPIDVSAAGGPTTGDIRGITNVVVDMKNTRSAKINSRPLVTTSGFTGKKEFRLLGYDRNPQVTIEQDHPLDMQINGLVAELIL